MPTLILVVSRMMGSVATKTPVIFDFTKGVDPTRRDAVPPHEFQDRSFKTEVSRQKFQDRSFKTEVSRQKFQDRSFKTERLTGLCEYAAIPNTIE
jgi:hypothetical protein